MRVCFLVNENWTDGDIRGWSMIRKSIVCSFIASTPAHRRHAIFGSGTLPLRELAQEYGGIEQAVKGILMDHWSVWSTFLGPDLCVAVQEVETAGVTIDSLSLSDARAMHSALKNEEWYLGAVQILPAIASHRSVFLDIIPSEFRIYGSALHVFHQGFETEIEDNRDHLAFQAWRDSGIFSIVQWEDFGVRETIFDPYCSSEHLQIAGEADELLNGYFSFILGELLIRCSDMDPNLTMRLHGAIKAFEDHYSAEGLAHVSLSCRRFIEKIADCLYPPRDDEVNGKKVGKAQYRNRLRAFIEDKMRSGTARELLLANVEDLGKRIDKLDAISNKGLHSEVASSEVNRLLLSLLAVSHDLLTLAPPGGEFSYVAYEEAILGLRYSVSER